MNTFKTALLAGVLATVSTMAFAQAGATSGVDFRSVYGSNAYADGNPSYAHAGQQVRTRAVNRATIRQHETTDSGYRGGSSPD